MTRGRPRTSRERRVAAVADYLLGLPLKMFLPKHGVTHVTVIGWVARAGCFRLRNKIASTRRVT